MKVMSGDQINITKFLVLQFIFLTEKLILLCLPTAHKILVSCFHYGMYWTMFFLTINTCSRHACHWFCTACAARGFVHARPSQVVIEGSKWWCEVRLSTWSCRRYRKHHFCLQETNASWEDVRAFGKPELLFAACDQLGNEDMRWASFGLCITSVC
jgi:hypothetical protein